MEEGAKAAIDRSRNGSTGPKPNNRDTSRKVAVPISQTGRKAKRNQQKPPLEPEIDPGSKEIS
jgi:hypothetical protein